MKRKDDWVIIQQVQKQNEANTKKNKQKKPPPLPPAFLLSPVEAMCLSCRASVGPQCNRLTLWPYLSQSIVCTVYHLFTLHSATHTLQKEKKRSGLPLPPNVAWEWHHILSWLLLISSTGATVMKNIRTDFFFNPETAQLFTEPPTWTK